MSESTPTELTEEQKKMLQNEAFIAAVLRLRHPPTEVKAGWLLQLLNTAAGAALITVLLGGILAAFINWRIQLNLNDRATQQSIEKTKGELALLSYKDYLEKRDETTKAVFELLGICITTAEDVTKTTGPDFDLRKFPGKEERVRQQREAYYTKFSAAEDEWVRKHAGLGRLVKHYYEGKDRVAPVWDELAKAMKAYLTCTRLNVDEFRKDFLPREIPAVCQPEKAAVEKHAALFSEALDQARTYLWKDWGLGAGTR